GEVAHYAGPRLTVVGGLEQVRLEIVVAMIVDGHISGARIEVRRLDARDVGVAPGCAVLDVLVDAGEGFAAIHTHLEIAVLGANPNDARPRGRLAHLRGGGTGRIAIVLRGHRLIAGNAHNGHLGRPAIDVLAQILGVHPPG